jgi:hypothetical protein
MQSAKPEKDSGIDTGGEGFVLRSTCPSSSLRLRIRNLKVRFPLLYSRFPSPPSPPPLSIPLVLTNYVSYLSLSLTYISRARVR